MLVHLISDYFRNPDDIRDRFGADPEQVIKKYNLSKQAISSLKGHDFAKLMKCLEEELTQHSKTAAATPHPTFWGTSGVTVTDVTPSSGAVNASVSLTVKGTNFPNKAKLVLHKHDDFNTEYNGTQVQVTVEPSGASTLTCNIKVTTAGSYDVYVLNANNTGGVKYDAFVAQ